MSHTEAQGTRGFVYGNKVKRDQGFRREKIFWGFNNENHEWHESQYRQRQARTQRAPRFIFAETESGKAKDCGAHTPSRYPVISLSSHIISPVAIALPFACSDKKRAKTR